MQAKRNGFGKACAALMAGCIVMAPAPPQARASGEESTCPAVWREYVQGVQEEINGMHLPYPLLFVSRAGDVHDCLGMVQDKKFLERATAFEKTMPLDRSGKISTDPATWPVNICTGGSAAWPSLTPFFTINLPLQEDILNTDTCKVRISKSVSHLIKEVRDGR